MTRYADRGKEAEKAVQKVLEHHNSAWFDFTFNRYPDARSARGALAAQPADFLVAAGGKAYHLEVKETLHAFRLTRDKISQLPTLKKFAMAGIGFAVAVYHSDLKKWRCIPQEFFIGKEVPASWDLSQFPLLDSAEEVVAATGWLTSL